MSTVNSTHDEDLDFTMSVMSFPVYDEGLYTSIWTAFEIGERVIFKHAQAGVTLEDAKPEQKERTAIFTFSAVDAKKPFLVDEPTTVDDLNYVKHVGEDMVERNIQFVVRCGIAFSPGSKKANSTKTLQGIVGRVLTASEVSCLRVKRMMLGGFHPVNLLVAVEEDKDGTERNKVLSIKRPDTFNGKKLTSIDITPYSVFAE